MPRSRSASKKVKSGWQAALQKAAEKRARGIAATLAAAERKEKALMLKALKRSQRLERTAEHRRRMQETYDAWRSPRKNPTKAQKREHAKKASAKRRVAVALAKFLKQANPGRKYAGCKMQRNAGGSITIIPIKANAGGLRRVMSEYGHQRRGGTPRLAAVKRAIRSTRSNPKRKRK